MSIGIQITGGIAWFELSEANSSGVESKRSCTVPLGVESSLPEISKRKPPNYIHTEIFFLPEPANIWIGFHLIKKGDQVKYRGPFRVPSEAPPALEEVADSPFILRRKRDYFSDYYRKKLKRIHPLQDILEVFLTLQPTKELPRQGFIYFGFKRAESDSVAAHSFTVASFAYLLACHLKEKHPEIDPLHVLQIALVHDWHEAIVGDVGYCIKMQEPIKIRVLEATAFSRLISGLTPSLRERLTYFHDGYAWHRSTAANIVRFADALDALAQGLATPGAQMDAFKDYNQRIYQLLKNDHLLGDQLADLFNQVSQLLIQRKVQSLRLYKELG